MTTEAFKKILDGLYLNLNDGVMRLLSQYSLLGMITETYLE